MELLPWGEPSPLWNCRNKLFLEGVEIVHYLQEHTPAKVYQCLTKTHPQHQKKKVSHHNFGHGVFQADYMWEEEIKLKESILMETVKVYSDNIEIQVKI